MLDIYVDADACPVKDEIIKVASRHRLEIYMVSNSYLRPINNKHVHMIRVDAGADVADNWIIERAGADDIVITADILMADQCVKNGSYVIKPTGKRVTKENIGNAVANRNVNAYLRELGIETTNASFSKQNRSQFLQSLEEVICKIKRTT